MDALIQKFNLPNYIKGKSFADASKLIQKKFNGRVDKESMDTKKELLGRLRQAQDHVKAIQEYKNGSPQESPEVQDQNQNMKGGVMGYTGLGTAALQMGDNAFGETNVNTDGRGATSTEQSESGEAITGALSGASSGATLGPWGAAGGALVGGLSSWLGAKKHNNDVQKDNMHRQAHATHQLQNQNAAGGMMDAFTSAKNVDTSGAVAVDDVDEGMGALKGAAAGAATGAAVASVVPGIGTVVGGAVGAVAGGVGGFVNAKKHNVKALKSRVRNTYQQAAKTDNTFESGGSMDNTQNQMAYGTDEDEFENVFSRMRKKPMETSLDTGIEMQGLNLVDKNKPFYDMSIDGGSRNWKDNFGLLNKSGRVKSGFKSYIKPEGAKDLSATTPTLDLGNESTNSVNNKKGFNVDLGSLGAKASEASRYAPVAMNALQLSQLKKPKNEVLGRLGNRYQEQLTDERSLQNIVAKNNASNRNAIVGASGGSGSAARANLIANSLRSTEAESRAYMQSAEANNAERRKGQQFNLGVDKVNLQQSNLENDINARNKGNYDTQKSKLMAQLGQDFGAIGKEELFKKYPELMGMDYKWLGQYIKRNKKKQEEANA